uniref:SCP domain-containing protein n=1 Tax=Parascaris univalens TaxID=6257 RepID=A0A915CD53_PARUN
MEDEGLDVIVQKYKALGYSEISAVKNQRYKFRFCVCDDDSTSPESDSRCVCSRSEDAELVQKSVPHALYSSSCIHSPNRGKCLVGTIISSPKRRALYVKLSIDNAVLTSPPYQKIPLSRFKNSARLTCAKEPCSESCIPCKSGFIEISYVVISKAGSSEVKALFEASDFRKLNEPPILQKPPSGTRMFGTSQIKAYKKLFSDLSQQKISSFTTIDKIKDYLLAKAAQIAVAPSTFNAKSFRQYLLKYHNIYRNRHDAPPLTNSDKLQNSAQQWAQQLANSVSCLKHDPFKRYGENLFFYAAKEFPDEETLAEATVQSFYIEAPSYDYHAFKPSDYFKTGHFTQLIWKSTKNLGIGVAIRRFDGHRTNSCQPNFDSNLLYVVVKYDPPGNVQSSQYYLENVSPARY